MEVITDGNLNREFKKIPEYRIDLGMAVHIDDSGKKRGDDYASGGKWKIKDKTIKLYFDTVGRYLNRIGRIGTLLFYVDNRLELDSIHIVYEEQIFKLKYDKTNIREFLSSMIKDVMDGNLDPYINVNIKEEKIVNIKNMSNQELSEYFAKNRD